MDETKQKEKQANREVNSYILQDTQEGTTFETEDAIRKYEQSKEINSIREAILDQMPEVYANLNQIRSQKESDKKISPINNQRGTRLVQMGEDVLELNLEGSSFGQFRAEKKELSRNQQVKSTVMEMEGLLSKGKYEIEDIRNYVTTIGQQYLTAIFKGWAKGNPFHDIHIIIQGQNKGATAALQGAMMLKRWVRDNSSYSLYERFVKFDLTQFDPVADLDTEKKRKNEMVSLTDSGDSTLFCSLHSEETEKLFSSPQLQGVNRLILTPYTKKGEKEDPVTYMDAVTQQVYQKSGLNQLAPGVYVLDEQNTLIPLRTYTEAAGVMKKVLGIGDEKAMSRNPILKGLKEWYRENNYGSFFAKEFEDTSNQLDHLKSGNRSQTFVNCCQAVDLYKLSQSQFDHKEQKTIEDYTQMIDACKSTNSVLLKYLLSHKRWHFTGDGRERVKRFKELRILLDGQAKTLEQEKSNQIKQEKREGQIKDFREKCLQVVHLSEFRNYEKMGLEDIRENWDQYVALKDDIHRMIYLDPWLKDTMGNEAMEIIEELISEATEEDSVQIIYHLLDEQQLNLKQERKNLLLNHKQEYQDQVNKETPVALEQARELMKTARIPEHTVPERVTLYYKLSLVQKKLSDLMVKQVLLQDQDQMKQIQIVQNQINEICRRQENELLQDDSQEESFGEPEELIKLFQTNQEEFLRRFARIDAVSDIYIRKNAVISGKIHKKWDDLEENIIKTSDSEKANAEKVEMQKSMGEFLGKMNGEAAGKLLEKYNQYREMLPDQDENAEMMAGMLALQGKEGKAFLEAHGDGVNGIMRNSQVCIKEMENYYLSHPEAQKNLTQAVALYERTLNFPHLDSFWWKNRERFYNRVIEKEGSFIEDNQISLQMMEQQIQQDVIDKEFQERYLNYLSAREAYISLQGTDEEVLKLEKEHPILFGKQLEIKTSSYVAQIDMMQEAIDRAEGQLYNDMEEAPASVTDKEEYGYEMLRYSKEYAEIEVSLKWIERTASTENLSYAKNHIRVGQFSIQRLRETKIKPEMANLPEIKKQYQEYMIRTEHEAEKLKGILPF